MRPIHANPAHPFVPGMQFVSNVIRYRLKDFDHILRGSDDFIRNISDVQVCEHDVMYKVDTKDLFMSRQTNRLAEICTSAAPSAVNGKAGFRVAYRYLIKLT